MTNAYLAHFGAQIATAQYGAVGPGIEAMVDELDRWVEFAKDGQRGNLIREGRSAEDGVNEFTTSPTTELAAFNIGSDRMNPGQVAGLKGLFREAARLASKIEDYNTNQGMIKSWVAGPGEEIRANSRDREIDIPGFQAETFPCGYTVGLEYEEVMPRYRASRYQQRFIMVLLGLVSKALGVENEREWDHTSAVVMDPFHVRFVQYGEHLTEDRPGEDLERSTTMPGSGVRPKISTYKAVLQGRYPKFPSGSDPTQGPNNYDPAAGPNLYKALLAFASQNLFRWVACEMPIKFDGSVHRAAHRGFPWIVDPRFFARTTGARFTIHDDPSAEDEAKRCDELPDGTPVPSIEVISLPTAEAYVSMASNLPSPGNQYVPPSNATMCRPFTFASESTRGVIDVPAALRPASAVEAAPPAAPAATPGESDISVDIAPASPPPPAPGEPPAASPYRPEQPATDLPPPPAGGAIARRRQDRAEERAPRRTVAARIEDTSMKNLMVATALMGVGATLVGVVISRRGARDE